MNRRDFNLGAMALLGASAFAADTDSIYNLQIRLTDQSGQARPLESFRGRPMLVTMFYTSCQMVCPMIVEAIRANEAQLSATEREKMAVLMVSFDPQRDTVAVLKATADQRGLVAPHWTLARCDAPSVRRIAAVLGIQYRQLADGEFNHSSVILLLDRDGRIAARTNHIAGADPAFIQRIRSVLI